MAETSKDELQLLEQAGAVLAANRGLIDRALTVLKANTLDGDRVSPTKLDDYQLVSYELSLCWAECTAASFLLCHARRLLDEAPDADGFTTSLACLFCAETIASSTARLRARPADFGLTEAEISAATDSAGASFMAAQLAADNLAAIGAKVLDRDGDLGADLLGEHHTMMRDTFRRFADDVVAPLAEEVHREDLIIPDEILEP